VKPLDIPCEKCGWKMPGFHVCVIDLRTAEGVKAATTVNYSPPKPRPSRARPGANRSESVKESWARRAGRAERDAEIIRLYDEEELSMNQTAARLKIDYRTVSKVLKAAAEAGDIAIRSNTGGRPRRYAA